MEIDLDLMEVNQYVMQVQQDLMDIDLDERSEMARGGWIAYKIFLQTH